MPEAFGLIGAAAIPALAVYLADSSHGLFARVAAAHSLERIGQMHPEARAECVAALAQPLERFGENDTTLNAFLIDFLVELEATQAAPLMERAFRSGRVDVMVRGDWEDIQIDLGLKEARETERDTSAWDRFLSFPPSAPKSDVISPPLREQGAAKGKEKARSKRKHAAKSRRRTRKRK